MANDVVMEIHNANEAAATASDDDFNNRPRNTETDPLRAYENGKTSPTFFF